MTAAGEPSLPWLIVPSSPQARARFYSLLELFATLALVGMFGFGYVLL